MAEITYDDLIPGTDIYAPTLIANVVNKSGWTVSCNMFKSKSILDLIRKHPSLLMFEAISRLQTAPTIMPVPSTPAPIRAYPAQCRSGSAV